MEYEYEPVTFSKKQKALTSLFNKLVEKLISPQFKFPYNATKCPDRIYEIADTFGIDIQDEPLEVIFALLNAPLATNSMLGTKKGMIDTLIPLLGDMLIDTHQNIPLMKPYTFNINTSSKGGLDFEKILTLANRFKSLRDNQATITILAEPIVFEYTYPGYMFFSVDFVIHVKEESAEDEQI